MVGEAASDRRVAEDMVAEAASSSHVGYRPRTRMWAIAPMLAASLETKSRRPNSSYLPPVSPLAGSLVEGSLANGETVEAPTVAEKATRRKGRYEAHGMYGQGSLVSGLRPSSTPAPFSGLAEAGEREGYETRTM